MIAIINSILAFSAKFGYGGIIFLMTIESSFVPFPSELVIPPAAYLAEKGEMNIYLVILSGVLGSLIGAVINYFIAMYLGRVIVYKLADHKIAKILLINSRKVEKAEKFFLKYGKISTLIGRLIPVVRQLISLPAGFSKMNFRNFLLYTSIGSSIWVVILAFLGYSFGSNQEILSRYFHEISLFFVALAGAFVLGVLVRKLLRRK